MNTLYELTDELLQLMDMAEDIDMQDEFEKQCYFDTKEGVEGEFEIKADGYAKVIKELEGSAATLDTEIKRLNGKKTTIENNVKRMKKALEQAMIATGKTKFKTDLFSFGIQKNIPALVLDFDEKDEKALEVVPLDFIKVSQTVDKTALKEAIKNGATFDFARLEQSESIRIR